LIKKSTALIFVVFLICFAVTAGQELSDSLITAEDSLITPPPDVTPVMAQNVRVKDVPNDAGGSIFIEWELSPDDHADGKVKEYTILRADGIDEDYTEVGASTLGKTSYTDNRAETGMEYFYKVVAINYKLSNGEILWQVSSETDPVGPVISSAQWFNMDRLNIFIGIIILCGSIIYFIIAAKGGKEFYIRKIAGIEEVENAVGRATEMGRSIYYIPGISDMDDVQTLASMTILGKVSEIAAQNDTRIDVPVSRSMVMVTAKEIVKESYSRAGRPDAHQEDQVRYLTDDQFGYAAAIDGLFIREKPATIFLIGAFFAESLIMAETGNSIGAIQIAGTAMPAQLPFFVAACDFTLIGEEMFAASAYLSREPKLLGSLKGQDVGKAVFLLAIIIGVILESFGVDVSRLFTVR
jgi:hypothetical protein